jgi:hypothetical protein
MEERDWGNRGITLYFCKGCIKVLPAVRGVLMMGQPKSRGWDFGVDEIWV